MTTAEAKLVTWSEFEQLDSPGNGERLELHDGEVVLRMPPATPRHLKICERIAALLRRAYPTLEVHREFPYRPSPDLQFWYADVAAATKEHWDHTQDTDTWVPGLVPKIIVEVVSPSNRAVKIAQQRVLALSNGCREFWQVEPDEQRILVTTADGATHIYSREDDLLGEAVADLFAHGV
jgi:Uma2 family endonuclease